MPCCEPFNILLPLAFCDRYLAGDHLYSEAAISSEKRDKCSVFCFIVASQKHDAFARVSAENQRYSKSKDLLLIF